MNVIDYSPVVNLKNNYYLFLDDNGYLHIDRGGNFIVRKIMAFLEDRNYDLADVTRALDEGAHKDLLFEKLAKKCGISPSDLNEIPSPTPTYLEEKRGDVALNRAIGALLKFGVTTKKVSKEALVRMSSYTHKTHNMDQFERAYAKVEEIRTSFGNNEEIALEKKITIKEMKRLEGMVKLMPLTDKLGELGEKIRLVAKTLQRMKEIADSQAPYGAGTIISYDLWNVQEFMGKKPNRIMNFFQATILRMKSWHLGVGINKEGQNFEAHMWGVPSKYTRYHQPLSSRIFTAYKVDMETLVDDPETMERELGSNWLTILEQRYNELASRYYFENEELNQLDNPVTERVKAMLFTSRYTHPFADWEEKTKMNKKEICSSFVAKSLLKILIELNDTLPNGCALTPPVRTYRRLERITPSAVLSRLIVTKAVREVEPPPIIQQTMHFKPPSIKVSWIDRLFYLV